jgi:hypothetical protein
VKRYVGRPVERGFADSLLHFFGAVVGWFYKMAFGGLEEFAYRRSRNAFIAEIERSFSDLFSHRAGELNVPRAFDYVSVAIEFKEVRFRIVRGRGELCVYAAPITNPQEWQELSLLWHRKPMRECGNPPSYYDELGEVAQRINNCWDQLVAALAAWQ